MSNSSSEFSPAKTAPSPELIPILSDPEISIYENNEIKGIDNYSIEQMYYLLSLAFQCEQYLNVLEVFEKLCSLYSHSPLSKANRSIIENAIKNYIETKQKQINKLSSLLEYTEKNITDEAKKDKRKLLKAINKEKERITDEAIEYLARYMKMIDCYWIKSISFKSNNSTDKESEVFLLRIKANNYKYLSQFEPDAIESKKQLLLSNDLFGKVYQISKEYLVMTNIEHLSLVYCYSNFLFYYMKHITKAGELLLEIISNSNITESFNKNEAIKIELTNVIKSIHILYTEIQNSKNEIAK